MIHMNRQSKEKIYGVAENVREKKDTECEEVWLGHGSQVFVIKVDYLAIGI